jgi:hypothetical protein
MSLNELRDNPARGFFRSELLAWKAQRIDPHVDPALVITDWFFHSVCCAQFLVHRDNIRALPLEAYTQLYEWLADTPLDDYVSGRYLEYTWHVLWGDEQARHPANETSTTLARYWRAR